MAPGLLCILNMALLRLITRHGRDVILLLNFFLSKASLAARRRLHVPIASLIANVHLEQYQWLTVDSCLMLLPNTNKRIHYHRTGFLLNLKL